MADASIAITPGTGASVDTFTTPAGDHRQAVVIGDPATTAVAGVTNGQLAVDINANQRVTYKTILRNSGTALVANTLSLRAGIWHPATATKTVRIRTIEVNALMSATIEATIVELHLVTAAPTGHTAVTSGTRSATNTHAPIVVGDANPEVSAGVAGTWVSAGVLATGFLCYGSAAAVHGGGGKIYDHQEGSPHKPLTLRAGQLEGIAVGLVSNAAATPTLTVEFTYTEE